MFTRLYLLLAALTLIAMPAQCRVAQPVHKQLSYQIQNHKNPRKKWTLLIFIQACNDLSDYVKSNLDGMMKTGSNKDINILVEYQKPAAKNQIGSSWRYHVAKNQLVIDEIISRQTPPKPHTEEQGAQIVGNEVFDSMSWAVQNYPAEKYGLIFWNHGVGVLDPLWSMIQPSYMRQPQWRSATSTKPSRAIRNKIATDRGVLFDEDRETYLTNQELRKTLKRICNDLLHGQKLEVIGMDACLMGMVEIVYQIKEYAHYFVASQEFELAYGWFYGPLLEKLAARPNMDGHEFCKNVVTTFDEFYERKISYYTQSAVSIERLNPLCENINTLSELLLEFKKIDARGMNRIIQSARDRCLAFSLTDYIDLASFYQELLRLVDNALTHPQGSAINPSPPRVEASALRVLQATITEGLARLDHCVIANKTGRYLNRAKGLSLYYPQYRIDPSYLQTEFAKDNKWLHFLAQQLNDRTR